MKTMIVRGKILKYFEKVPHADTYEILDFINRTTKHGVTTQAIGSILSNMSKLKLIVKISDYSKNSVAIWGRNKEQG